MSDTYYDTHPNNPANQDEPVSKITYVVSIDEFEHHREFDTLEDAEKSFNEYINGLFEFHEIEILKYTDEPKPERLKYTNADTLFLELKKKISEHASRDNGFAWSLLRLKV